jgi:hypothetical protein
MNRVPCFEICFSGEMIKARTILLLFSLVSCRDAGHMPSADPDPYKILTQEFTGLEEATSILDMETLKLNTGLRHCLPAFQLWYERFPELPRTAEQLCMDLLEDIRDPQALLYHAYSLLAAPAGGHGPPLTGVSEDKRAVSFHLNEEGEKQWQLLPAAMQAKITAYVLAWEQSARVLEQFLEPLREALQKAEYIGAEPADWFMEPWREKQLYSFTTVDLIQAADLRKLSFASRLLAGALKDFIQLPSAGLVDDFKFCELETEMGSIGIFGKGRDTIPGGYGLVIDLGGDDLYTGDIACAAEDAISVVLDFSGNDSYLAEDGTLVRACPGIAMLFDLDGDDEYHTGKAGLASACYGTSMICDLRGNDTYRSGSAYSQGTAHLGAALLVDLEGDDIYSSRGYAQGFGGTLGIGMLLDLSGDDQYNPGHSGPAFVLGSGRGRWAAASDGHSLGGGLGVLVDAGGSDRYRAGSFSQGASYFTGTGLFFDLDGDDQYDARSHSQGYAAHYAISGFFEMKGNDSYNAGSDYELLTQLLGNGRDRSAAWFVEESGNDTYHMGNRSGGIGDMNGIGILWDRKGRDSLIWHRNQVNAGSPSLGQTVQLSEGMSTGYDITGITPEGPMGWFRMEGKYKLQINERP